MCVTSVSLWARGSAAATKFLASSLPVDRFTHTTLHEFLRWLVQDLEELQAGRFSASDWRGPPLGTQRALTVGQTTPLWVVVMGVKGYQKWSKMPTAGHGAFPTTRYAAAARQAAFLQPPLDGLPGQCWVARVGGASPIGRPAGEID